MFFETNFQNKELSLSDRNYIDYIIKNMNNYIDTDDLNIYICTYDNKIVYKNTILDCVINFLGEITFNDINNYREKYELNVILPFVKKYSKFLTNIYCTDINNDDLDNKKGAYQTLGSLLYNKYFNVLEYIMENNNEYIYYEYFLPQLVYNTIFYKYNCMKLIKLYQLNNFSYYTKNNIINDVLYVICVKMFGYSEASSLFYEPNCKNIIGINTFDNLLKNINLENIHIELIKIFKYEYISNMYSYYNKQYTESSEKFNLQLFIEIIDIFCKNINDMDVDK